MGIHSLTLVISWRQNNFTEYILCFSCVLDLLFAAFLPLVDDKHLRSKNRFEELVILHVDPGFSVFVVESCCVLLEDEKYSTGYPQ